MPDQQNPSEAVGAVVIQLNCNPGIQRDGTVLDAQRYIDGQWVRFYRGRPKKMNGYREVNRVINGPVRAVYSWSRQDITQVTLCSPWGIEAIQLDRFGAGQNLYDRTPSAFSPDGTAVWQVDSMYDAAAGSQKTRIFAYPGSNLDNIDSAITRDIYTGDASTTDAMVAIGSPAQVSGGFVCAPPYLIIFGSDGQVTWSNENEPLNLTTGSAGTARITGSKLVKGMVMRGQGTSPTILLWSLDTLFRMSYVGGQAIFRFDAIGGSTILSASSVVEYDGAFYWVGLDRFMVYKGGIPTELPNTQNLDWFFDNLNYAQRQKVHVVKVPRHGEIWWFFPKGDATECTNAVIYNVRENYWYDVELGRSAASYSNVFRFPLMADTTAKQIVERVSVNTVANFNIGDTVNGSASACAGTIVKILNNYIYVLLTLGTHFQNGETLLSAGGFSTAVNADSLTVSLYQLWQHEFGTNRVEGDNETGIRSFFETSPFGFLLNDGSAPTKNNWTRLERVEPDFSMVGQMLLRVIGAEAAEDANPLQSPPYAFTGTTQMIDMREQRRELRLQFTSNEENGDYKMGKILLHVSQGDGRN